MGVTKRVKSFSDASPNIGVGHLFLFCNRPEFQVWHHNVAHGSC